VQAAHQRRLRPGSEYNRYWTLAGLEKSDPILADGDTFETIRQMDKWIRRYQPDTAKLAPVLQGKTVRETCENDWNFAYQHFQYKLDKDGVEQLRRPLRSWADRRSGIDCDCYAILLSTLLLNQGIPHKLRKTKYNNEPDFQHIYVVVPQSGGKYITLDPVVDAFDKEVPFTGHFDHDMQIQGLNGGADFAEAVRGAVPAPAAPAVLPSGSPAAPAVLLSGASGGAQLSFGAEFRPLEHRALAALGLAGLGAAANPITDPSLISNTRIDATTVLALATTLGATPAEAFAYANEVVKTSDELLNGIRLHLVNTRRDILAAKETSLYDLASAIAQVLEVWNDAPKRDGLIAQLGANGTVPEEFERGAIIDEHFRRKPTERPLGDFFGSIGDFFSGVGSAVGQAATWVGGQVKTAVHAVGQAASWVGTGVANGAVATWSGIKQASGWVAQQAVVIGKLILKYNPLSVLIRAALRVAFRVNLFYMSERLAVAYATDEQARAAGLNEGEFRKAQDRLSSVQSIWNGLQGDAANLRSDILSGNRNASNPAKIAGLAGLAGVSPAGLGEPATAAAGTAAATPIITTILNWLKSVDWKKLFATASAVAGVAKSLIAKYAKTPTPGETYSAPLTDQEYYANQPKYNNPASSGISAPLVVALLGGAYLVITSFSSANDG
jgi:hypothetical protein